MHSKGLCHRDIKPSNIILTVNEKHAKIADFNVSKYFIKPNGEHVRLTTHTGTLAYCAPETFSGKEYT